MWFIWIEEKNYLKYGKIWVCVKRHMVKHVQLKVVWVKFCRFGTQYTRLGIRLEKHSNTLTHHINLKWVYLVVRSCVESGVKDFGVISVENGYQIYIGGNGVQMLQLVNY